MNLNSEQSLKNLLKKYGLRPSKGLGQNFLIDKNVLKKIIEAANLKPGDIVLEIGPGIGNLTVELAKKVKPAPYRAGGSGAGKVIAVEKDPKLARILNTELRIENVRIINDDILKIPYSIFDIQDSYKVVANLPYYITSPVIRKFLESETPPEEMLLMVQKEVAQRICSQPPDMNLLAVSVQFYARPEIISFVSKESFWPQPKVDSAIIKIIPSVEPGSTENTKLFFKIVRAGFSHPRKQIANNLAKGLNLKREEINKWLLENNIQPTQRAETLALSDWLNLAKKYKIR